MKDQKIEKFYKQIYNDNSPEIKVWKTLPNGCKIATMGYSEENIPILMTLLQSFAEQYGEIQNYETAKAELKVYRDKGKLFVLINPEGKVVSMNGTTYNEQNASVDFVAKDGRNLNSLYFYGLSTLKEERRKGYNETLIAFVNRYAYYAGFDLVYARTDLNGSNSEKIMENQGLHVCKYNGKIIAEKVQVTEEKSDERLHLVRFFPNKNREFDIISVPKDGAFLASDTIPRVVIEKYAQSLEKCRV